MGTTQEKKRTVGLNAYVQGKACPTYASVRANQMGDTLPDSVVLRNILKDMLHAHFDGQDFDPEVYVSEMLAAGLNTGRYQNKRRQSAAHVLLRAYRYLLERGYTTFRDKMICYEPEGDKEQAISIPTLCFDDHIYYIVDYNNSAGISALPRATKGHVNNRPEGLIVHLFDREATVHFLHLFRKNERTGAGETEFTVEAKADSNLHTVDRSEENLAPEVLKEDLAGSLAILIETAKKEIEGGRTCSFCPNNAFCEAYVKRSARCNLHTPLPEETTFSEVEFDEDQKRVIEAILNTDKDVVLLTPPGAGKTAVLTQVIARLSAQNKVVSGITFTNAAAREICERCEAKDVSVEKAFIGTIHSFAFNILKEHGTLIFGEATPKFLEDTELMIMIRDTMDLMPVVEGVNYTDNAKAEAVVLGSLAKKFNNYLTGLKEGKSRAVLEEEIGDTISGRPLNASGLADVFDSVAKKLKDENYVTYDEIFPLCSSLLEKYPQAARQVRQIYRVILVDEYQDTSLDQHEFLMHFQGKGTRIVAVGDPYQSIYGFRNATTANFLSFSRDPNVLRLSLSYNYRSSNQICEFANTIVGTKMRGRFDAEPPKYYPTQDSTECTVKIVKELIGKGVAYKDIAVLCRSNSETMEICEALTQANVPANFGRNLVIYDELFQLGVNVLSFLVSNGEDIHAFARIMVLMSMEDIAQNAPYAFIVSRFPWMDVFKEDPLLEERKDDNDLTRVMYLLSCMRKAYMGGNGELVAFFKTLACLAYGDRLTNGITVPLIDYLQAYADENAGNAMLGQFLRHAKEMIYLGSDAKLEVSRGNHVSVTTIHDAKGLEWEYVILSGVASIGAEAIPTDGSIVNSEYEQERNLFYVGVTRAKRGLYLIRGNGKKTVNFVPLCEPYTVKD